MGRLRQPGKARSNQKVVKPKLKAVKKPKKDPIPKTKGQARKTKKKPIVVTTKQLKKVASDQKKLVLKFHAAKREYLGPLLMHLMFRSNHPIIAEILG